MNTRNEPAEDGIDPGLATAEREGLHRQALLLVGAKLGNRGVRFVVWALLARRLELAAFGDLAFSFRLVLPFVALGDCGLELLGISEVAKGRWVRRDLIRTIVKAKFLLGATSYVAFAATAFLFLPQEASLAVALLLGGLIVANEGFFNWPFLARGYIGTVAVASTLNALVLLAGTLLFVHAPRDALIAALVLVLAPAFEVAMLFASFRYALAPRERDWLAAGNTRPRPAAILREAVPLGITAMLYRLYAALPAVQLGWLGSVRVVGAYQAAAQVQQLSLTLAQAGLNGTLLPRLSRAPARDAERSVFRGLGFVVVPVALAAALALLVWPWRGDILSLIFGAEYRFAGTAFALLIIVAGVDCALYLARVIRLSGADRPKVARNLAAQVGLLAILQAVLIPQFGLTGVVMALMISGIAALVHIQFVQRDTGTGAIRR